MTQRIIKGIENLTERLLEAKQNNNKFEEGRACCCYLGIAYHSLGDFQRAIDYQEKHLSIAKDVGNRAGEGHAYCNLGNAYRNLDDFQRAIEYHEKHLSIAKDVGNRAAKGRSSFNLGNAFPTSNRVSRETP